MATKTTPAALSDPISGDLKQVLRALKLGRLLDTLPERLTLAKQQHLAHADFLELVLADEVTRRDTNSAALRARAAGLDASMRLESWDATAAVRFDQQLWNELTSLRFLQAPHGALILGPALLPRSVSRWSRNAPIVSAGRSCQSSAAAGLRVRSWTNTTSIRSESR
jgi:hypothetical protein